MNILPPTQSKYIISKPNENINIRIIQSYKKRSILRRNKALTKIIADFDISIEKIRGIYGESEEDCVEVNIPFLDEAILTLNVIFEGGEDT